MLRVLKKYLISHFKVSCGENKSKRKIHGMEFMKKTRCEYSDPKKLRKSFKKSIKTLKKHYLSARCRVSAGSAGEWLCDNRYLLEQTAMSTLDDLRYLPPFKADENGLPAVYNACMDAVLHSGDLEENLRRALEGGSYTLFELDSLMTLLKCAAINSAASAIEKDSASGMELSITAVRNIDSVRFERIVSDFSETEEIFMLDPAGKYADMSEKTKSMYREKCAKNARRLNIGERQYAEGLLERAKNAHDERYRHIGAQLFADMSSEKARFARGMTYIAMFNLLPALAALAIGIFTGYPLLFLLIYLPLRESLRPLFESLSTAKIPPFFSPRMDMKNGVPADCKTLVTVSCIVPAADRADGLCRHLEELFRANSDENIYFCLLADLKEADTPTVPGDAAAIRALKRRIKELNQRHGERFLLIVRRRVPVKTQGKYAGFERKRGALCQLMARISGEHVRFADVQGDISILSGIKYVMAVDSDTELPVDTVRELVSIAAHPLNHPVTDPKTGTVVKGSGIIVPKIAMSLGSVAATRFSRITGGVGGITAYDSLCGNMYQDLFGKGIFSGKGLIDVGAFNRCMKNAFPNERILSHDVLEGAYLGAMNVSDVEVCDGCPSTAVGWFARQHRWIRGDIQNLSRAFGRVRTLTAKTKNPINRLYRYHLIDTVLKELSSNFSLAAIITSFFVAPIRDTLLLAGVNAMCSGELFAFACTVLYGGFSMLWRRCFAGALPQTYLSLEMVLLKTVMTVKIGFMTADAVLRSLYRMIFSHKKLLEWTPASGAERFDGLFSYVISDIPSVAVGVSAIAFGNSFLRLFGFFAAACPFVLYALSRPVNKLKNKISVGASDRIKDHCAQMWKYFEDNCNAENNFLPPDNVQLSPVFAVAHRTSPTNIGLMLLSVMAAHDLGLIDTKELLWRCERAVSSIEKLKKYNNQYYNWYDTKNLMPLHPRFCSFVDTGNLACCLYALQSGLKRLDDLKSEAMSLCERIMVLERDIDLSFFYDERRGLFKIGFDVEKNRFSESCYDLFMSESRMSSYYAIARRQVPKKHWARLSRALSSCSGYSGPVSWTGTVFEYFMPALLMDVYDNTLTSEALGFCIHAQRKRARKKGTVWGCSESGFYAFDAHFNYRYKAHGVQKLGLQRGLDDEFVVSPYSSFLALMYCPGEALLNLETLEKMGASGIYGFYEAVDFTPSRCGSAPYAVVRSYMVHHIGMSMCAAADVLCDGIFKKRFMRGEMLSCRHLLEEKIPLGSVVYNETQYKKAPRQPGRDLTGDEEFDDIQPTIPRAHLLSNGDMTAVISDCGAGMTLCNGVSLYRGSDDILRFPKGVFVRIANGKNGFFVTRAPDYSDLSPKSARFSPSSAEFYAERDKISAGVSVTVHPGRNCEFRRVVVKNNSPKRITRRLEIYLEPLVGSLSAERSHPAFSHLFVGGAFDSELNILTFSRRSGDKNPPVSVAIGFFENISFDFSLDRSRVLTRPYGAESIGENDIKGEKNTVSLPDGCAYIAFDFDLLPRGEFGCTLIISVASDVDSAAAEVVKCRNEGRRPAVKCAVSPVFGSGLENRIASILLPCVVFGGGENARRRQLKAPECLLPDGLSRLWGLGISGDNPLVLMFVESDYDAETAGTYIAVHSRLRRIGVGFDLCIVADDSGEYGRPLYSAIFSRVQAARAEYLMSVKNGIFILEKTSLSPETIQALRLVSVFIVPKNMSRVLRLPDPFYPLKLMSPSRRDPAVTGYRVKGGVFLKNGGFAVTKEPQVPWCHIIAKEDFGTLVSDKALGFTFAKNSHMSRLTKWINDPAYDNTGERVILCVGNTMYDMTRSSAVFEKDKAVWYSQVQGMRCSVEVTLLENSYAKRIRVNFENGVKGEVQLAFYCEPVLGTSVKHPGGYVYAVEDDVVTVYNPFCENGQMGKMYVACSEKAVFTNDRAAFLCGDFSEKVKPCVCDGCMAAICRLEDCTGKKTVDFLLGQERLSGSIDRNRLLASKDYKSRHQNSIKISCRDKATENMFNFWLMYQADNSRIKGRTGFYQCSGAYGFRDQLQDMCAVLYLDPAAARRHILLCCQRQFYEGDVLHWWHEKEEGPIGVRTKCSDDMLWLVYAACEYVTRTNDLSLLYEKTAFLQGEELKDDEIERYFSPVTGKETASVIEHCKRAISRVRFGEHGLPLIGSCDWNDGFSNVGANGRGESVWLAEFLKLVCDRFAKILKNEPGEEEYVKELEEISQNMLVCVKKCFEGDRYTRAYFDDGTPIGSKFSQEAKIDVLPQAFAAFAGIKPYENVKAALCTAEKMLVDHENGIISLFWPPFERINAGYISAYPPGIRENGGQYTHGAVWLIKALFETGSPDKAYELLKYVNPAARCADEKLAEAFKTEPYSVPADVYRYTGLEGRGGWTQYTGAAAWLYRVILCSMLGIDIQGDTVYLSPSLPDDFGGYSAEIKYMGTAINLRVIQNGKKNLTVDGKKAEFIPLDKSEHIAVLEW